MTAIQGAREIDSREEAQKRNVAASSVVASLFLTVLKLIVGLLTGSIGIISEALHSALDLGAASITFFAVRASGRPADTTHHYGHGKIESFSALAETVLLFITSGWIIYEAVKRLMSSSVEIEVTWYSFAVMAVSIVIDISRSRVLYAVARKTNSQALEADALHFKSDIWSSSVVIAGLVFVLAGLRGADAIAAMGVAMFVIHAGWQLGRRTVDVLLDTAPAGLSDRVEALVNGVDGVAEVARLRIRPAGPSMFIETAVAVSRRIPLERVQEIRRNIAERIRQEVPRADIVVEVNPVALSDETIVQRVQVIVTNHGLAAHDIRVHTKNGRTSVNFDLEVEDRLSLDQAHGVATHIEQSLAYEFGPDTEVNIHIEPLRPSAMPAGEIGAGETQAVEKALERVRARLRVIRDIHNVSVQRVDGRLFISLHCVLDGGIPLVDAHEYATRIEYLTKEYLANVERVVVHLEPAACDQAPEQHHRDSGTAG